MDLDILQIDAEIRERLESEKQRLSYYMSRKDSLTKILNLDNISVEVKNNIRSELEEILKNIQSIESDEKSDFYTMETVEIIESYRELLKKPKKVAFCGKSISSEIETEKKLLSDKYIRIARKYGYTYREPVVKRKNAISPPTQYTCINCSKRDFYNTDERVYICTDCGYQFELLGNSTSYKDITRVNLKSIYTYERVVHFEDCIKQYQGKQNSSIPPELYQELERQLDIHGLINQSATSQEQKYEKVNREHIDIFLKELGYSKYYEDIFLIYYKITGKKPDNISHLETKLIEDFEILSNLYDVKFKFTKRIERKNFINNQYLLFQLLRKHRHPCRKEDFNMLKTLDRKNFHDEICEELFSDLGWNFTPFF